MLKRWKYKKQPS
jgi:hypothetical protein